jgi:hypothetical protein
MDIACTLALIHSTPMLRTLSCSLLALTLSAHSQDMSLELVRNGGFENLDKSISTYDQLPRATGWTNATLGLSEVFDAEASAKTVGIPENDYGTMEPKEGERYAGFCGWKADVRRNFDSYDQNDVYIPGWDSYSEYLKGELIKPLIEDSTYEIVMHVALSGNSDRTIMGVGAHVSQVDLNYNHRAFMEEDPQVYMEELIMEKGKWVEIRGTFVADGKEQWIYLGVFPYVGLGSKEVVEGPDNLYAYFYIDGVSLKMTKKEE